MMMGCEIGHGKLMHWLMDVYSCYLYIYTLEQRKGRDPGFTVEEKGKINKALRADGWRNGRKNGLHYWGGMDM